MPINEALFWVGITVLGAGGYILWDRHIKSWAWSVFLLVLGALAVGYSVYLHSHPNAPNLPVWAVLVAITWVVLGYLVYMRARYGPTAAKSASQTVEPHTQSAEKNKNLGHREISSTQAIPANADELIWVWRGMVTEAQEISKSKGIEAATVLISLPHYPSLRPHLSGDLRNKIEGIQSPTVVRLNAMDPIVKGVLETIDRMEATWQLATGRPAVNARMEVFQQFRLGDQLSQLGQATSATLSIPSGYLYQAWYEHAIIVWSLYPSVGFYRLPVSGANWTWIPDPDWGASSAPAWRNDGDLRKRFEDRFQTVIPKELHPPYAGEAFRWWKDPDGWSWIGWRISNTIFEPDPSASAPALPVYQEFEHGLVIGGLVMAKDGPEPMRLVLYYENAERITGKWKLGPMDGQAPKCKTPP